MRLALATLVLFLWAIPPTFGQSVVVGDSVPQKAVEAAQDTISRSKAKLIELDIGEFELFVSADNLPSAVLWLPTDESIVNIIDVPANTKYGMFAKRRGETEVKSHIFPPSAKPYRIVQGAKPGSSSTKVIANGKTADEPPAVVDNFVLTTKGFVPPPKPVDPPPLVDNELAKQLRLDYAADLAKAKADKKWLKPLALLFAQAAEDDLSTVATVGDLDTLLNSSREKAGIPDPLKMLTTLRTTLRNRMLNTIGVTPTTPNLDSVLISPDVKRLLKPLFQQFAQSLEVVGS